MSDVPTPPSDFFDLKKLRKLAELMRDQDLSEIQLQAGDTSVRLRRQLGGAVSYEPRPAAASVPAASAAPAASSTPPADDRSIVIKSPMIGTFYVAPSPDAQPFIKVGDHIGPETVVCLIEAMKVFNDIQAECSGKIISRLVENGAPVEYGQPLFRVDPNG